MKVVCINHQEFNSILDILRLYFQDISLKENSIKIEEPKTSNINCTIVSSQNMEVTKEQMRDQADQSQIFVQTFIEASDLKISNTVVPSALRRELKRQMYFILSSLLNISYPWGSLTGIRPTQIALRVYQAENCNFTLAKESLMKFWFVSEEKAKIALETAIAEDQILQNCNTKLPMLYIGIPFCSTRCSYCSFITQDATTRAGHMDIYTSSLIEEIKQISDYMKDQGKKFSALYIGGGTPTALSDPSFEKLIDSINDHVPLVPNAEITVEAGRADSITFSKLKLIKTLGDVRICINPQTMHDHTLKLIGRDHTVEQVYDGMKMARELGFENINMDLILGLPQEEKQDFLDSLEKILELKPQGITVHTMALKRSAFLEQKYNQKYLDLRFPDQDLAQAFSKAIHLLKENQYFPYYLYRQKNVRGGLENIGFAKKGFACNYNVGMMSDQVSVIGLGSGSTTKIVKGDLVERNYNPKDILIYSERITELIDKKIDFLSKFNL